MANENLTRQIVTALLRDGSVPFDEYQLTDLVQAAVTDFAPGLIFRGVVKPGDNPGRIGGPTLWAACTGGTYYGFGGFSVDQFCIVLFGTADGAAWDIKEVYNGIGDALKPGAILGKLTAVSEASTIADASDLTKAQTAAALGISEDVLDGLFGGMYLRFTYEVATLIVQYVGDDVVCLGAGDSVRVTIGRSGDAYAIAVASHDFSEDFSDDFNG